MYACIQVCIHIVIHIVIHVYTYAHTYLYIYIYIYIHMCVCAYMYAYIHVYIYIYIYSFVELFISLFIFYLLIHIRTHGWSENPYDTQHQLGAPNKYVRLSRERVRHRKYLRAARIISWRAQGSYYTGLGVRVGFRWGIPGRFVPPAVLSHPRVPFSVVLRRKSS